MLVAIHQPNFMPWLGYFDRMIRADLFVLLDHVQFERRNYQNRCMIRLEDDTKWLTVPVVQLSQKEKIIDKRVDNPEDLSGARWWGPNHFQTLKYAYRKAAYFAHYAPRLQEILSARWDKLADLNIATLEFVREALAIDTPMVRSSTLACEGQKSGLLLDICQRTGATAFLGGMGGSREYLDKEAFAAARMGVEWQQFSHPAYPQCGPQPFIPCLSSIDLLANCGPDSRTCLEQPLADTPARSLAANLCVA